MFCNMGIKTKGQIGAGVIQGTAGRRPEWDDGSQRGFQSFTKKHTFRVPPPPPHLQRVVDSRLRRVDDEVSQREAEALRGPAQAQRLGPRPGEGLLLCAEGRRGRRVALVASIFLLRLEKTDKLDISDAPSQPRQRGGPGVCELRADLSLFTRRSSSTPQNRRPWFVTAPPPPGEDIEPPHRQR